MKRLKLNLDQLGEELGILDPGYLQGIKGGYGNSSGSYGGYNSWQELWDAMQNGYLPPAGTYNPGGSGSYGGYGNYGGYSGYGGYNGGWPGWYPPGTGGGYGEYGSGGYGSYGGYGGYGGYGAQLPNGDCLFNMVAYMLNGNTYDAQCYKGELISQYHFTQKTLPNGQPAYEYYPADVAAYMRSYRPGYTISFDDTPTANDIQSVLSKSGGKVGASYNGHNYMIERVLNNGWVKMSDPSNPGNSNISVKASVLSGVYNFYEN